MEDTKNTKEIINTTIIVLLPDPFGEKIVDDQFEDLKH